VVAGDIYSSANYSVTYTSNRSTKLQDNAKAQRKKDKVVASGEHRDPKGIEQLYRRDDDPGLRGRRTTASMAIMMACSLFTSLVFRPK
jgi:hypothetical protein